ncbi:hypothetical protein [Halomonas litopenaei]|uniref:hypothetical protein n=1 Tax=Halomonas litopenaei TaxID=2109328 RepID=UPI001A8EE106|nr:hypothetical protein [Halomonas litopenaei]MBN8412544.1 hypothetical protein [Halomonas litopenaei]
MRLLIMIIIGVALVLLLLLTCPKPRQHTAMWVFSLAWLGVCAWNLSVGLSHGYALGEELLVHALLFGVPAGLGWWRVCREPSSA